MRTNPVRILLIGKRLSANSELFSSLDALGARARSSETLTGAVSLLRLRSFDVVLSEMHFPEAGACAFLKNLLSTSASLIFSYPVESTFLWVPALWNGRDCWGTLMMRPAEFRVKLGELLAHLRSTETIRHAALSRNARRTCALSPSVSPALKIDSREFPRRSETAVTAQSQHY